MRLWEMLLERPDQLSRRLAEHLYLTACATAIAVLLGVALGTMARQWKPSQGVILGTASVVQTIPSLALLTFLLPFFGIGTTPAIIALTLYALLPIVRNTYAGLSEAPAPMLEMADALGLSRVQRLMWIEARFALPFVIAGIRTAAVVSVGIATLSAFIGAGGLGVFINRGLALNNTDLVLFGAVPAGLLALFTDAVLATLEGFSRPMAPVGRMRIQSLALAAVAGVTFFGLRALSSPGGAANDGKVGTVIVGSKNFTEQLILGQMLALLLEEKTNLQVVRKLNLAGTSVCHEALRQGGIDLYVEYTGTALTATLGRDAPPDPTEAWQTAKREYLSQFGLEWLPRLGFANTYALAVRESEAEQEHWKKVSDLRASARSVEAGFTPEFLERDDGYPGLAKRYGFKFGKAVDMDPGLMYDAVKGGEVDVVSAFSTDGRIAAYDLRLLEDDRRFFPPYDAAVVARGAFLAEHPEAREAIESLSGKLNEATMQRLNLAVDRDKKAPIDVAREFLAEQGLIGAEPGG